MAGPLTGTVAMVTGASRGVGKGIALGLGEAGATVYLTGRSEKAGDSPWPGTIHESAAQVTEFGGQGIAVRCDHRDDAAVKSLFDRIGREQGRLDILVNNAIAQESDMPIGVPFWELPLSLWDDLHAVGLRSYYVASWFAAPMLIKHGRGLIVNISSGGATQHMFNVPYGVGKAGVEKLTRDTAHELKPHGVAVVSLWPGLVKTEMVQASPRWAPLAEKFGESAQLSGRAVAALASDPELLVKAGQTLEVRDLALAYSFTDVDGTLPSSREERLGRRT